MTLQAYDFATLYREHGVEMQMGGADQWGNITAGLELIRRTSGDADESPAHGIAYKLLLSPSGAKFGKSEGGDSVWLDPDRTTPYAFYQYWVQADDRDVGTYLRWFTELPRERIEALDAEIAGHPEQRAAQRELALDVTRRVHGAGRRRRGGPRLGGVVPAGAHHRSRAPGQRARGHPGAERHGRRRRGGGAPGRHRPGAVARRGPAADPGRRDHRERRRGSRTRPPRCPRRSAASGSRCGSASASARSCACSPPERLGMRHLVPERGDRADPAGGAAASAGGPPDAECPRRRRRPACARHAGLPVRRAGVDRRRRGRRSSRGIVARHAPWTMRLVERRRWPDTRLRRDRARGSRRRAAGRPGRGLPVPADLRGHASTSSCPT